MTADAQDFKNQLFTVDAGNFEERALALFRYQAQHNRVYNQYLRYLRVQPNQINEISRIPFLPVEFFKGHRIVTGEPAIERIFESSRTTGQTPSRHYVADAAFYQRVSTVIFGQAYGKLADFHLLALLPSYVERGNSSLVYMVQHFIDQTGSPHSGFFLRNESALIEKLWQLQRQFANVLLIGVTFALLDLAERVPGTDLSGITVMETGGMKGRREELLREEVHERLQQAFNLGAIHAEYGMTELLSQAYSSGNGIFQSPPWMRVLIRDINDPFRMDNALRSGGINLIDLANVDSCAFIETKDLGQVTGERTFRVLGRFDNSDVRGCSLMVA